MNTPNTIKHEGKTLVSEWVSEVAKRAMNSREIDDVWERTNEYLTATYGSPAELMRRGAEASIQLTEDEWTANASTLKNTYLMPYHVKLIRQALANCRPKQQ